MGASLPLKITLGLVMLASAIELSFISATVAYLHQLKNTTFSVWITPNQTVHVPGLPGTLLTDQGHTANGAAGTGLVLIGCGGLLALWLRGRPNYYGSAISRVLYRSWVALTVPALLLTLVALAYVFALTRMHAGGGTALMEVPAAPGADFGASGHVWTPQGWLGALLDLDFMRAGDRQAVLVHERVAKGWEYNLIPFFLVQLAQTVFALLDARRRRAERGMYVNANSDKQAGFV